MNTRTSLLFMALVPALFLSIPSMSAQTESPVACVEGSEPLDIVYGDYTTGCEISPSLDLDQFRFDGTSGDIVRIVVRTYSNYPDPRMEIRDPDGLAISDTYCGTTTSLPCTLTVNLTLDKTGSYYLALSDKTNSGTGSYTIQLEKIPPVTTPPGVAYNSTISDEINPVTDVDFFTFEGAAGTDVRMVVSTVSNRPDPRLEIWDPNGDVLVNMTCGTTTSLPCSIPVDLSLTITGNYLVAISDTSSSGTGNYNINLQCLFGSCPSVFATRAECDIQMSQDAYVNGETATANVFRFANPTNSPILLEMKIWLGLPNTSFQIINLGADGSFVLPAGANIDLGPLPILPVSSTLPRDTYELSCRMLNPKTGRLLMEDRNFFDIQ